MAGAMSAMGGGQTNPQMQQQMMLMKALGLG